MKCATPYFESGEATALIGRCRFAEALACLSSQAPTNAVAALQGGIAAQHMGRWVDARHCLQKWVSANVFVDTGPLVSVVIPTKDRREFLPRALASVANQIYRPLEAVVVNDAGASVTDIIDDFREQVAVTEVVNRQNLYLAQSRNVGSEHASGSYIGFLDDDDHLYPHHVGHLVALLLSHKGCRAAASGTLLHDLAATGGEEVLSEFQTAPFELEQLVLRNVVPVQAVLLETSLFRQIGLFDPSLRSLEDWELWVRLRCSTEVAQSWVPTACVDRRHEQARMSKRVAASLVSFDELCFRNRELAVTVGGTAALNHQRLQLLGVRAGALDQAAKQCRPAFHGVTAHDLE